MGIVVQPSLEDIDFPFQKQSYLSPDWFTAAIVLENLAVGS